MEIEAWRRSLRVAGPRSQPETTVSPGGDLGDDSTALLNQTNVGRRQVRVRRGPAHRPSCFSRARWPGSLLRAPRRPHNARVLWHLGIAQPLSRPPPREPGGGHVARRWRPEAGCGPRGALVLLALALCAPGARGRALEWYSAVVSTEYRDPRTNQTVWSVAESGRFGDSSPKEGAQGLVGVPRAADHDPEGCSPDTRFFVPPPGGGGTAPWVALVARGGCNFKDKVLVAARQNASAVVVYNEERHGNLTAPMSHAGTGSIVVIMVSYPKGKEILDLVQKGISVKMTIEVGTRHVQEFISGQSVVFVAIAFITMMIISLAWLIFYYIQRFLYTGSQFGSQGELEDGQEMPVPELAPGSVVAADLSIAVQEDDRSDGSNSPLSSTNEPVAQCGTRFKEDSGENTALLGDLQILKLEIETRKSREFKMHFNDNQVEVV
ncbi:E3 ubiquitin-protein ligase RNF149 [Pteropus alecto]|uniref:E3 ubiquitin-protein ligase RNF149 n=1 Tax=Pteropus alecto TaxID=9402 RepID=L5K111_PTEAL|nr:E3 ubiquitin-protein ligase RNF149 [Pteropus alecto]